MLCRTGRQEGVHDVGLAAYPWCHGGRGHTDGATHSGPKPQGAHALSLSSVVCTSQLFLGPDVVTTIPRHLLVGVRPGVNLKVQWPVDPRACQAGHSLGPDKYLNK